MQPFHGSAREWNSLLTGLPGPHLLQTWEWARVKSAFGWQPQPMVWERAGTVSAAAMVLSRRLPLRGLAARTSLLYIPKGPLVQWEDMDRVRQVLDDIQGYARRQGAIFLKIDPDVVSGWGVPGEREASEASDGKALESELRRRGWCYSADQVQFRNTVLVDLRPEEAELLARMKQKTRYNIRLAERKGVRVRTGTEADLGSLYDMYAETAARDGFVIRERRYYQTVWETFMRSRAPHCEPLVAEVAGEPVAALFLFHFAGTSYYLYGMSRQAHREKMPNYLLQWEAIRRAKAAGDTHYDLWGAPEVFDASDDLWGVYRFKDGLGGQVRRTLGAWDFPSRPWLYRLYTGLIPRVLDVMRLRGMARIRRNPGA